MFDLNLSINCDGKEQSPATSLSSVVNGDGDFTSSNDDTCSPRATPTTFTFNFGILNNNSNRDHIFVNEDQGLTGSGGLVTRELLPVSRLGEVQPQQPQVQQGQARKSRRGPRSRSSQYRGVTFYRRTGRWESHIWDCGKQVYLGGFDTALAAARAYDRAAIRFRGVDADINFSIVDYEEDMKQMKNLSKEEFVHILRRQSNGAKLKYGQWEARMGQLLCKKAYDKAALQCNGRDVVTNFEPSVYDAKMTLKQRNEGSQQDLDLNLGISSSLTKTSRCLSSLQYHPYDVQNSTTLKLHVENRATTSVGNRPLKGVPITSEQYPILWSGVNPILAPNYEETRVEQRMKSISQKETLWSAASSGFLIPSTTEFSSSTSHRFKPPS